MSTNDATGLKTSDTADTQYSYHTEPPAQGGARFVRCEECGSESVPADPDRVLHHEGCSQRQ
jgi:hypothetical protein